MAKKRTIVTVQSIIQDMIQQLQLEECTCASTIPTENADVTSIKCYRCEEIEKLQVRCTCGKCDDCLHILLDYYKSQPCTCTYKDVEVSVPNPDTGLEDIVTEKVVDVKCARCIKIEEIESTLSDHEIMRKAYIDEADFDKYVIVDGVIQSKVVESGKPSDIDVLRETLETEQLVQNFAIDTMMFEIIPSLEDRLPQVMSFSLDENKNNNLMKGLVRDMGAYFADRIIRGVVTYTQCFSISMYKKYQDDTDVILRMEGYGHLITRV